MLSTYYAGALLEAGAKGTVLPVAPPFFLALLEETAVRGDTGATLAAKEASYGGYTRTELPSSVWGTAGASRIANDDPITLPSRTSGQAQVIGWAICSAATAGEMLFYGAVTPFIIDAADPDPILPVGRLVLAFANPVP